MQQQKTNAMTLDETQSLAFATVKWDSGPKGLAF